MALCTTLEKLHMKKTLVALAVLAASGASMAQSTVTLYGIADVWFGSETNDNGTTSLSQTKLNSGGVNGSRFGLRGSEDLGAGLKANFQFEQGFTIDDGVSANITNTAGITANSSAFSRHAWVGLSGGFGSTRFGRTPTPYDDVNGASDAVFDSNLAPMNSVFKTVGHTVRSNNTLAYYTPSFGGVTAAVAYGLGEDKTATADAGSLTSFNVAYAGGPLTAHVGYQSEKLASATGITTSATTGQPTGIVSTVPTVSKDFTRVGVTYDFGAAKLYGTYGLAGGISNKSGAEASEYQLGVDVPFGATTLSASYATSQDNATAGDAKRTGYGIGARYALSKRTFAYGGYESDTTTKPATLDAKHTVMSIGLQHRF